MDQNKAISSTNQDQIISHNTKNTSGLIGFVFSSIAFALVIYIVILFLTHENNKIQPELTIGTMIFSAIFAIIGIIFSIIGLIKAKKNSMKISLYVFGIILSLSPFILYVYSWITY